MGVDGIPGIVPAKTEPFGQRGCRHLQNVVTENLSCGRICTFHAPFAIRQDKAVLDGLEYRVPGVGG